MAPTPYAELHCHTNFSFLDGASPADDLVERATELGLTGLAVTDHAGLYGAVRFVGAAEAVGLHPVIGLEIELLDPAVADPGGIVVAPRRARRRPRRREDGTTPLADPVAEGVPTRPRPERHAAARSSRAGQGGSARDRRARSRTASRAARPVRGRVAEPVPADLAGEHGRDQGRAAVQPGAPCRPHRGPRRAVGLSRRGARAPPAGGRPVGRARRRGAVRRDLRAGRGRLDQRLLHRALPPPARRRRLARRRGRGARGRAWPAGRRDQRRALRPAGGPRAGRRPDRHPTRTDPRHARRPASPRRRILPEVRRGAGGDAAGRR